MASGTSDLGIALFKSNGATYYAGRSAAQVYADANGNGGDEFISYTATTSDWYGVVVWCNNAGASATYSINIPQVMSSGTLYSSSTLPDYYKYTQNTIYWTVMGIRPPSTADYDLRLYDDLNSPTSLATSSWGLTGEVDYIVADYNHITVPESDYPYVYTYSGTGTYYAEWENGSDILSAPGNNGPYSWSSNHVVKIWDVYLNTGQQYDFDLDLTSGTADLGFALFKSNNAAYYSGRSGYQVQADANGAGQDESFTYTPTTSDYYGLVVWCNNSSATATYNVNISLPVTIVELANGTVYSYNTLPGLYKYNQTNIYWAVTGLRSPATSDYDLYLYDDVNFSSLLASSTYVSGFVDFVVGDYNHNTTPQWDYPRVVQYAGTGSYYIEWEDGTETLTAPGNNGPFSWVSNHVVKIWDSYLTSGQQLTFNLSVASGTADLGFALFKSNAATYYVGRSSAQVSADANGSGQSETFTYTVTTTDWYGLVVWCNNSSATATYNINISAPQLPIDVTMTPIGAPIVIPATGGSFNFSAAVIRNQAPPAPFWVWGRVKNPNGTYTPPNIGPVQINPPVGVQVSRTRTQNVPGTWASGTYYNLGYANGSVGYPTIDADSFSWIKSATGDGGPFVWEASCYGEPFPYEVTSETTSPTDYALIGANPNPFNPTTTVSFQLPEVAQVTLNVFDMQGRLVTTLVNGMRDVGVYNVTFDGTNLASGVYLYALQAGSYSATGKMVLMK